MILISKKNNFISISGHAMYDDFGKDIVCSAVSSIVITTINGIISINKTALKVTSKKDGLEIEIRKGDSTTLKLIDNMMELLTDLSKNYPRNIQIKEGV